VGSAHIGELEEVWEGYGVLSWELRRLMHIPALKAAAALDLCLQQQQQPAVGKRAAV